MLLPDLTQEQIVERGAAAKLLLQDPRFQDFFEQTRNLTLVSMGNTLPENSIERERLYLQYNALGDLWGTMQSYVDAAEAILLLNEESEID
jgi:hypothetical protein